MNVDNVLRSKTKSVIVKYGVLKSPRLGFVIEIINE